MRLSYFIPVLPVLYIGFSACSSNTPPQTKAPAADTVAKTLANPRSGKIWEQENIVKIPLTAAENGLRGAVKSVMYREYEFTKEGSTAKDLVDSGYNVYDRAGHLVDQNEYYADKSPKWHCTYKYDDKNKPAEWDLDIYDDNMNSITTFKYDAAGNKTEETTTDSARKPMGHTAYQYDAKGNETAAAMFDKDNKLKKTITYLYDQRGFQTTYKEQGPDGEVYSKLVCAYDDNGNKISGADYSSDTGLENKWVQKNDAHGHRIETDYYLPDGTMVEKRTIAYDDHGYPVAYNTYKKDGTLFEEKSYSYNNEYDQAGNITRQTEIRLKDGKHIPATYKEYVITYY